jgi:hypothetical protein
MEKNKDIVGYVPNLLYKFYLRLKERFDPPRKVTQEEIYCFEICKKLIFDDDSKLTIAPLSDKRYIKNDKRRMFVVLENGTINLINHVYSYSIYCEYDNNYNELIKLIDSELEKKRIELECEIKSNISNSLKKILDDLSV